MERHIRQRMRAETKKVRRENKTKLEGMQRQEI